MMLLSYADHDYYISEYHGSVMEDIDAIDKALEKASRHIDSLTYNRIVAKGMYNLTTFQQEIVRKVVCGLAEFETENADMITSVVSSYSINGVSMQLAGGWNVHVEKGVAIPAELYSLLSQTGLTCRLI